MGCLAIMQSAEPFGLASLPFGLLTIFDGLQEDGNAVVKGVWGKVCDARRW